eukprot:6715-Heterococcus_DN1.PRE.1
MNAVTAADSLAALAIVVSSALLHNGSDNSQDLHLKVTFDELLDVCAPAHISRLNECGGPTAVMQLMPPHKIGIWAPPLAVSVPMPLLRRIAELLHMNHVIHWTDCQLRIRGTEGPTRDILQKLGHSPIANALFYLSCTLK